jgi:glyoxylase I family protein
MTDFPSLGHIAVTVTDLERSTQWYTLLFGSKPVLDEDEESGGFHHTVYALSGGQLFGLHTHTRPTSGTFD